MNDEQWSEEIKLNRQIYRKVVLDALAETHIFPEKIDDDSVKATVNLLIDFVTELLVKSDYAVGGLDFMDKPGLSFLKEDKKSEETEPGYDAERHVISLPKTFLDEFINNFRTVLELKSAQTLKLSSQHLERACQQLLQLIRELVHELSHAHDQKYNLSRSLGSQVASATTETGDFSRYLEDEGELVAEEMTISVFKSLDLTQFNTIEEFKSVLQNKLNEEIIKIQTNVQRRRALKKNRSDEV